MSHYNPDQYTEPQSGLTPDTVEQQLSDWIEPYVLADCIVKELVDQREEPTLENAKKVWLDVLENLPRQLEVSVARVKDRMRV